MLIGLAINQTSHGIPLASNSPLNSSWFYFII